ncbi:MAG: Rrf2 family transcriptional regulator [Planctomycetes bacterium]|nr:Rrf2 family transcriptional regulator [Planctomycetota bacterium]
MLLNQTAVYGLRAMSTLARLAPGESLNAAALSSRTGVPQQYLSKVMRKLVLARLVIGRRGHGGGFSLQRPPHDIRLGDVLAAVDQGFDNSCAFGYSACDLRNPCSLHPVWNELKAGLEHWASNYSLADLGPEPERVRTRRPPRT